MNRRNPPALRTVPALFRVPAVRTAVALFTAMGLLAGLQACGSEEGPPSARDDLSVEPAPALGPVDGLTLPGVDTGRVAVGDPAPDFTLASYRGDSLTLSEVRGLRDVILVFYRGSW